MRRPSGGLIVIRFQAIVTKVRALARRNTNHIGVEARDLLSIQSDGLETVLVKEHFSNEGDDPYRRYERAFRVALSYGEEWAYGEGRNDPERIMDALRIVLKLMPPGGLNLQPEHDHPVWLEWMYWYHSLYGDERNWKSQMLPIVRELRKAGARIEGYDKSRLGRPREWHDAVATVLGEEQRAREQADLHAVADRAMQCTGTVPAVHQRKRL